MSEASPTWTDPRTWRFRDKVSASALNVDLRDNLLWLKEATNVEPIAAHGATDGGDNTQAILDAVDALDTAKGGPGGIVWLGSITSGVTSTITLPTSVGMLGAGQNATTLRADDANLSAVLVLAGRRESAAGFAIDGNSNATHGLVAQDCARTVVSDVKVFDCTDTNFRIDETWDGASGNIVLTVFEYCFADGAGAGTTHNWFFATGNINNNGILLHHCHGHSASSTGAIIRGLGNRLEGGTWVNNGDYGIDVAAGQSHLVVHPWLEGNTTDGMKFTGSVRSEVHLLAQGGQGVDWANSAPGNIEVVPNNSGDEGALVYRAGLFPHLGDDAHAVGDGPLKYPRGYSMFLDVAGNFPAGANGSVETFSRGSEGWQRNWNDTSVNEVWNRASIDGSTWGRWERHPRLGDTRDFASTGDPEGSVTAPVGSTYRRTDGGSGTTFYVKESGTGNTGWVAK